MFSNHKDITLESLNQILNNTLASHLGMEVTETGENHLVMRMPVDHRTIQSFGILNGGANLALAETAGSLAANLCIPEDKVCVGLDINGNHIRPVRSGYVYGKAVPVHIGNATHVWEIRIVDDHQKLVCICRLTLAIIDKNR